MNTSDKFIASNSCISEVGDIELQSFKKQAYTIIDWIVQYKEHIHSYPVFSTVSPGDIAASQAENPPLCGESFNEIFEDFINNILPGVTHWNHPAFFAYFGISGSGPGILGEMLSAALNVNAMMWRTSPSATELEEVVLNWLGKMIGISASFKGVITDTASIATMLAISAARERLALDIRTLGMCGRKQLPRLRIYTSIEAHSSIEKAAITLGIGQLNVVKISTDDKFQMDVSSLESAIKRDIEKGYKPFCIIATVGTTSTTSIDPIEDISKVSQQYHCWLHVDGAYGACAAIAPEFKHILKGCDQADSLVLNPHKWLFTPLDCSAFYVRDPELLKRCFSLVPEYLKSRENNVTNYMDWGVQLGRRFRSLKLWMVIRQFGQQGLSNRIREHILIAQDLAKTIEIHPDFELMAPVPFSTLCFRALPRKMRSSKVDRVENNILENSQLDRINEEIVHKINLSGAAFLSHTRIHGRYAIRMAIGNIASDRNTVYETWEKIVTIYSEISCSFSSNQEQNHASV